MKLGPLLHFFHLSRYWKIRSWCLEYFKKLSPFEVFLFLWNVSICKVKALPKTRIKTLILLQLLKVFSWNFNWVLRPKPLGKQGVKIYDTYLDYRDISNFFRLYHLQFFLPREWTLWCHIESLRKFSEFWHFL